MSDTYSPADLAAKIEWEGGVVAALEYGLKADSLDDSDPELKRVWVGLCEMWGDFGAQMRAVEELLPDPSDG